jgi:hypothetical protein
MKKNQENSIFHEEQPKWKDVVKGVQQITTVYYSKTPKGDEMSLMSGKKHFGLFKISSIYL